MQKEEKLILIDRTKKIWVFDTSTRDIGLRSFATSHYSLIWRIVIELDSYVQG